ncbi:response regulator [Roseibium marinum]|uniref:CheY-like chemotaxis protein n=1 Tax=Roseibium marinum TaxID=281252 RepID=A0A2S3UL63_9HYPH|nr:response regulator [Roseibium marinum]POF28431.1 CheY-like chemotaxis protein [Roseibium marinum]
MIISPDDNTAGKSRGAALVVEDNPIIALDTKTMLEELGFSPVTAVTRLADGIELLVDQIFCFAILDLQTGDTSSQDFAALLARRGLRFVFATGYGDASALPVEFQDRTILRKPYTKAQIEKLL